MKLRPVIFWPHLVVGALAGLVILMMSVTGVLLTYERQIVSWAEQSYAHSSEQAQTPLSADQLMLIGRESQQGTSRVTIMYVHRWFGLTGDSRGTGRAITGAANLMFLFLLVSGIYLWLPKVWNQTILRSKMLFNPRSKSGKARDFNWHQMFAFWAFIPLFS